MFYVHIMYVFESFGEWEFWQITFSNDSWHGVGWALYRDSKEQYKPIVWLSVNILMYTYNHVHM